MLFSLSIKRGMDFLTPHPVRMVLVESPPLNIYERWILLIKTTSVLKDILWADGQA
jgi:hypothetical protein